MSNRNRDYKTLRPGQLKRKFLRLRHAEPAASMNFEPMPLDSGASGLPLPDEIDPYDPDYGSLDEYLPYEIIDVLRFRTTIGDQVISEQEGNDASCERGASSLARSGELKMCEDHEGLVEDIFHHLSIVADDPLSGLTRVRMDVQELRSLRGLLNNVSDAPRNSYQDRMAHEIFAIILLFLPFRIRSFDRWNGAAGLTLHESLLRHLFVRYEPPDFMARALCSESLQVPPKFTLPDLTQMVVFVLVSRGISLGRLNRISQVNFPPSVVRQFPNVPANLDFRAGLIWARLRANHVHAEVCNRLIQIDHLHSWKAAYQELPGAFIDLASWLQRNWENVTNDQFQRISEWYRHELIEWHRAHGEFDLTLFGRRSVATIMRRVIAYEEDIQIEDGGLDYSWATMGIDWTVKVNRFDYEFKELLSKSELVREGRVMRHCVGSYGRSCKAGRSAIFSIKTHGRQIGTVEIDPLHKYLKQVYGKANTKIDFDAYRALKQWLAKFEISEG